MATTDKAISRGSPLCRVNALANLAFGSFALQSGMYLICSPLA